MAHHSPHATPILTPPYPKLTSPLIQVAETLPEEVLDKIKPVPRDDSGPIITAEELPGFDGLIFGMPTRFGMMPSQVGHWQRWGCCGVAADPAGLGRPALG